MYVGIADASLLENSAALQHAAFATPATGSLPLVEAKPCDAIDTFGAGVAFLAESLDDVVVGRVANDVDELREQRVTNDVPAGLAARSARWM